MKKIAALLLLIILLTSCLTPKPEKQPVKEPVVEVKPEPVPEPEPEVIVEETPEPDVYIATEEEYDRTFEEVEELIAKLNKIISSNDYNTWQNYLSKQYIDKYGDKEFLTKISDNPILKDYGIKLKTLRDYFRYVVVPSRSNVVIDEIQFITEDRIKAFTFTNNDKFVVYILIRENDQWIISD